MRHFLRVIHMWSGVHGRCIWVEAFDHYRLGDEQLGNVSAELGTRRRNRSILLLVFILFFLVGVLLRLVDDFVDPFLALDPHVEVDMEAGHEVNKERDNLESQVQRSVILFFSAERAISDEATKECNEHDNEAIEHIDAEHVVQPRDVGADEGGREHDELSQPLDDVE